MRLVSVLAGVLTAVFFPLAAAAQTFRITGTVVSAVDSSPVPRTTLSATTSPLCSGNQRSIQGQADGEGHFALSVPCAGTWRLRASAPGFTSQLLEQHTSTSSLVLSTGVVLTRAEPSYNVAFRISPESTASGFLLDEAGEAVRNAQVMLLDSAGASHAVQSTTTDDRGFFEFTSLLPGDYLIAALAQPWYAVAANRGVQPQGSALPANQRDPNLDLTYPLTYFPGVTEPSAATVLHVAGGASLGADFHLSPVPSLHLLIAAPSRTNAEDTSRDLIHRTPTGPPIQLISPLGQTQFQPTSVTVTPDGSLDLGGFAPGTYATLNFDSGGGRPTAKPFSIGKDTQHAVELSAAEKLAAAEMPQPGESNATLTGFVMLDSKPAGGVLIVLVPVGSAKTPGSAQTFRQQSNTDGSFKFDSLAQGNYILVAIEHGWGVDLSGPGTVNGYLVHGTAVSVTGATVLKRAVEAQVP